MRTPIKGFEVWSATSTSGWGKRRFPRVLASWHNPRSITWRWSLWVNWEKPYQYPGDPEPKFFRHYGYRNNYGLQWGVGIGKFSLDFHQQHSMFREERTCK